MDFDISSVTQAKSIRKEYSALQRKEAELLRPKLTDLTLIPTFFKAFTQTVEELNIHADDVELRMYFCLFVLNLYSPQTLTGKRGTVGLRKTLADTFGIKAMTTVSDYCRNLSFLYDRHPQFRKNADTIYRNLSLRVPM